MVAALAIFNLGAWAQDKPAHASRPAKEEAAEHKDGPERKPPLPPQERISRLIEELNLPPEQVAKVKEALKAFHQANEDWTKEHAQALREAREKLAAARQSDNKDAIKAAREALEKLTELRRDLVENLRKQLLAIPLTREQVDRLARALRGALEKLQAGPMGGPMGDLRLLMALRQLNLTPEQIERIKKDVLTGEQRKKLEELMKAPPPPPGGPHGDGAKHEGGAEAPK